MLQQLTSMTNIDQLASKSYSDSTPPLSYVYYSADRLQAVSENENSNNFSDYDGLGRPTRSSQSTRAIAGYSALFIAFPFSYTYNLADQVTSVTLPSGRTVSTIYDNNTGRVKTVSSVVGSQPATTYFQLPSYAPHGALQQVTLGNGLIEQACFNARLQPVVLRQRTGTAVDCTTPARDSFDLLHLSYAYGSNSNSANTGNIITQTSTYGSKTFVQNYTYDLVNRLATAAESGPGTGWQQTYGYDVVGNRWLASGIVLSSFTPTAGSVYDNSNRMNSSGAHYDGAGNQTDIGGYHYTYDAENRMTSSSINGYTTTYLLRRRRPEIHKVRCIDRDWTYYVYDGMGTLAAEYTTSLTRMACKTLLYGGSFGQYSDVN